MGITDTAFVESVATAECAAKSGASGLVLSPPFYYTLSQSAFLGYLERITPLLPLPLYLYNMPDLTKLVIAPKTLKAASSLPNAYGPGDSSRLSGVYFRACKEAVAGRPDFALLGGVGGNLEELVAEDGAHGGVCGGESLPTALR